MHLYLGHNGDIELEHVQVHTCQMSVTYNKLMSAVQNVITKLSRKMTLVKKSGFEKIIDV